MISGVNLVEVAFSTLAEEVQCKRTITEKTIIFCQFYDSCTHIPYFFRRQLGQQMLEPEGYRNPPES